MTAGLDAHRVRCGPAGLSLLIKHPFGTEFELQELPPGCESTRVGWLFGASRQWRGEDGLHVREYQGRLLAHYDRVDPRRNLIGHWIADAPFELALGSSGMVGMLASFTTGAGASLAWIAATVVASIATSAVARKRY